MCLKALLLSLSLLLLSSFLVGLAIIIQYAYLPSVIYQKQGLCEVYECTSFQDTCCHQSGKIRKCGPCTRYYANISLDLNGTIYDKVVVSPFCNLYNNTCYYDTRNIYNTLSLLPLDEAFGPIIGIMFLSVGLLGSLLFVIAVICYLFDNKSSKKNKETEVDDL